MPKCEVCSQNVYPMDPQINLDGNIYHKTCAKCEDCKCQITLSNFTKTGTTLLCKTHYFKRFSEGGTYLGGEKYSQKSGHQASGEGSSQQIPASPETSSQVSSKAVTPSSPSTSANKKVADLPEGTVSIKDRMKNFGSPNPETEKTPPSSDGNPSVKEKLKRFSTVATKVLCPLCTKTVYNNDPQLTIDGTTYHKTCAKCDDCKCQITLENFTKTGEKLLCKTHYFKRFSEEGTYLGGEKYERKTAKNATITDSEKELVTEPENTETKSSAEEEAKPAAATVTEEENKPAEEVSHNVAEEEKPVEIESKAEEPEQVHETQPADESQAEEAVASVESIKLEETPVEENKAPEQEEAQNEPEAVKTEEEKPEEVAPIESSGDKQEEEVAVEPVNESSNAAVEEESAQAPVEEESI